MEGVPRSPTFTAAKGPAHKLLCGLLQYRGELLHCLEVLEISSVVYDTDGTP